jgi:hypothetical protein
MKLIITSRHRQESEQHGRENDQGNRNKENKQIELFKMKT